MSAKPEEIAVTPKAIPTASKAIKIGPRPGFRYQSVKSIAHKITKFVAKAPANTVQNLFRSPPSNAPQKIPVKMEKPIIHVTGIFGSDKKLLN